MLALAQLSKITWFWKRQFPKGSCWTADDYRSWVAVGTRITGSPLPALGLCFAKLRKVNIFLMISITTPEGLEADIVSGGDASLQVYCDKLNETHFGGSLPPISVSAVSRFKHPTVESLHAITLKTDEVPDLQGLGTPWLILIDQTYCELPFVAQLMLHEMTHVLLPDENPYHSERFWATLRDKWLIEFDLVLGVGLNGDEKKSGLTKQLLDATSIYRHLGL
jgi:hypothetical protein